VEDKITINNLNIANYVMFKLDKLYNSFSLDEINQITELVIDYNEENDSSFVFLLELLKFNNIKSITLRNGFIYSDNYNIFLKLDNLEEMVFENCEFENADLLASLNLKSLSLINCKINNYSFISIFKDLEKLTIVNGMVEIRKINFLKNLDYLQLSYSKILDDNSLELGRLTDLAIDNTNIENLLFVKSLPNLKRLSIDFKQYNSNRDILDYLKRNKVEILQENIVEFGEY